MPGERKGKGGQVESGLTVARNVCNIGKFA